MINNVLKCAISIVPKEDIYSLITFESAIHYLYSISMHIAQYDRSIIGCDVKRYNTHTYIK